MFHAPDAPVRTTVQLGDPALIAARTGLTVVGDFRRGDMALGGQGAPLVPAFHRYAFQAPDEARAVVNIGGIANVTLLNPGAPLIAFDTGPGNTLLDAWCAEHTGAAFDARGQFAASGQVNEGTTDAIAGRRLLQPTPAEKYRRRLLQSGLGPRTAWTPAASSQDAPKNVQATLAELTAATVAAALPDAAGLAAIAVCGGGAYNDDLLTRLRHRLPGRIVQTTADWGIPPELVEAAAFAWFARERLEGRPSNAPKSRAPGRRCRWVASTSRPQGCNQPFARLAGPQRSAKCDARSTPDSRDCYSFFRLCGLLALDTPNFKIPDYFINRELSALEFNRRVLHQAKDTSIPLLERLKFLCIVSTNLDEFFEIRVSGLRQRQDLGLPPQGPDMLTARQVLQRHPPARPRPGGRTVPTAQ